MSVKRFDSKYCGWAPPEASADGDFVSYSDYEQLERTAKMLAEALDELQNDYCNAECERCPDHTDECKKATIGLEAARKDGLL
jgi:hypothetical protein